MRCVHEPTGLFVEGQGKSLRKLRQQLIIKLEIKIKALGKVRGK
jgi:hypothetical protein